MERGVYAGDRVSFHLYTERKGLGAEECRRSQLALKMRNIWNFMARVELWIVLISRPHLFQDAHSCQNKVLDPWSLVLDPWSLALGS